MFTVKSSGLGESYQYSKRPQASKKAKALTKSTGVSHYVVNDKTGEVVIAYRHGGIGRGVERDNRRPNPRRKRATARGRKLMRSGSKKLAAWVRANAKKNRTRKRATTRRKKNPVRVAATMAGKSTGWMPAKAVRVVRAGGKVRVDVKR